jgi:hypothetical protein
LWRVVSVTIGSEPSPPGPPRLASPDIGGAPSPPGPPR